MRPLALCALLSILVIPTDGDAQEGQVQALRIDSVAVTGNVRQSDLTIMSLGGITADNDYTIFDIQKATKALWSSGQFVDVVVRVVGNVGERVTLIWEVEEQDLMRNVAITGLVNADAGEVRDTTGLRPGRPYSPSRVKVAKEFIRTKLAAKGIPFARIDERIERIAGREKEIILYLDVVEGSRITVADVVFHGNELFSDEELRGVMSVQPEGFMWWKSGSYDRRRFEEDLSVNLPARYARQGYLEFRVVGDSLVIDTNSGKTRIEITVDEGPQYRLADFSVTGNSAFSTEELERHFTPTRVGLFTSVLGNNDELPVFDQPAFRDATQEVGLLYQNEGYLFSQVIPFVNMSSAVDGEQPTVSVGWTIQEGSQAYIARVDIAGNEYTYERVIRDKIFILPGDVYSQDLIIRSFQNISSLGYFEVPLEIPSIIPNESGDVDVTFKVAEKPTGAVNFGTSVGGGTGLSGFIGYDQPNLFGMGKSGSFRWDFGRFQNNQTISYTDPALGGSLVSGSVNLFNARDRFISFQSGARRRRGGNVRFGFPIPGARFTRLFLGYGLSRSSLELRSGVTDQSLFGRPSGTQSTLSVGITRQTLNHPLFPTSGSRQSVNIDFNGGPLGGDGKFMKTTADGSWWVPIGVAGGDSQVPGSGGMTFALGLTLRTGAINGNSERFPFERFWMGGVQFGQQLRGYDETTITPLGFFPERSTAINDIDRLGSSFFSMTTELAMRVGGQLSVSGFFDAGNVWLDTREIDPTKLFRGAGFGLQLVTPFGPVGLDYAYGFDKPVPGWQLHFRLGPGF